MILDISQQPGSALDGWRQSVETAGHLTAVRELSAQADHRFSVAIRAAAREGVDPNWIYWRDVFALVNGRRDALLQELAEAQDAEAKALPDAFGLRS